MIAASLVAQEDVDEAKRQRGVTRGWENGEQVKGGYGMIDS